MASTVLISGNTYPVKDRLRAMGGKWNPTLKGWAVPAEREQEALALVASAPKSAPRSSYPRRSSGSGRCRACGGPIRHAAHHRAMGGYCGNCAFDEFDC